mmetsp:Transcript_29853/g.47705  ORF Transcript_29853/g.47705 Transcript_29853/m.47705 type:complete len:101 (-) Transcript_29853:173-475(-)
MCTALLLKNSSSNLLLGRGCVRFQRNLKSLVVAEEAEKLQLQHVSLIVEFNLVVNSLICCLRDIQGSSVFPVGSFFSQLVAFALRAISLPSLFSIEVAHN